ncbi:hypothetical protein [Rhodopirellula halodulae]|uniref:hypothetical protein n=1 Tax=Rhodopirellula halodulae TaxID=2894198 RepID=UPI001E3EC6BE|nr:hypothetical protein [Rhodopirellula sp. JC737]MCC9655860.1 hypothetical protein [Rhodopirellula sp. JC737]
MKRSPSDTRGGIILLVVLSMLAFFSVLAAAFLVFSNQSRRASFAIASRNIKQSHPNALLDEALMTLIRGTDDGNSSFFGEDMLSDYYGRTDFTALQVGTAPAVVIDNNAFITFPVANDTTITGGKALSTDPINDLYTGRVVTFTSGNLEGRSFRVLRSVVNASNVHELTIATNSQLGTRVPVAGDTVWMNGVPRNAAGIGFSGTNIAANAPRSTSYGVNIGFTLPVALQPKLLDDTVDKSSFINSSGSDFDESYDAADFNNWFLSYRDSNGVLIPSFHRPSVMNYILNETTDWNPSTVSTLYSDVVASLVRGTFRPFPVAEDQLRVAAAGGSDAIHPRFTGGSPSFALRAPIPMRASTDPTEPYLAARARLNQLASALVEGPWDVDNDFDGVADSIWIDLGLPMVTSPEGRLLRPLVAPMIRDLSGRLNVNTHGNYALINQNVGLNETVADWAGTTGANQFVFRGLGYGPAEINIPGTAPDLFALLQGRYQIGGATSEQVPGRSGADAFSVLRSGWRPASLIGDGVYKHSIDPYGRGGYGLSLSGAIVPANDGDTTVFSPTDLGETLDDDPATTGVTEPASDELVDNPYEFDPTGNMSGDRRYTESELEAIVRANEFDSELLPSRLTEVMRPLVTAEATLANATTTLSVSDDSPYAGVNAASAYDEIRTLLQGITPGLTNDQLNDLVAPELRLAKKLNVNRPFGNGVDDNGNDVVDEPREVNVPGYDDDGNGVVDDASEQVGVETEAFQSYAGETIDTSFTGVAPDYVLDDSEPVGARQLLARHLYVLMMIISRDLQNEFPGYGDTLGTPVPVTDREAYRARRLAQWAVNVVDYRDSDSIMTRFVYDPNPFDGWAVADDVDGDGVIDTTSTPDEVFGTSATPPTTQSPVVFGCEQPDLVFTESYATHDVRVRDTDLDGDGRKGNAAPDQDEDTDQVRIPQGSLFMELYCPRRRVIAPNADPNTAGIPRELYDVDTTGANVSYSLDLERTITTYFDGTTWGDTTTTAYEVPIWRIAISEPHFESPVAATTPAANANSPIVLRDTLPDTLSFHPELASPNSLDEIDDTAANLNLERFVFFTDYADTAELQTAITPLPDITEQASVFFNYSGTTASLFPEQYLTLAPRVRTNLGSLVYAAGPGGPSEQAFEIQNAAPAVGLIQFDAAGNSLTPNTSTDILPGLSLPMSGFPAGDWSNIGTTSPNGIGLNVSEPLAIAPGDYYAEPTNRYLNNADYPLTDAYIELDAGGNTIAGVVRDEPEDMQAGRPIRELTEAFVNSATVADPMLGTVPNYRTAFLQRLADPTRGFHPTLNPYRTLDQIAIDLTVFSGEETPSNVTSPGDPAATATIEVDYAGGSRQRDGIGMNGTGANLLYSYSTDVPAAVPNAGGTDYFNLGTDIQTTFNYLNTNFGVRATTPIRGRPANPFAMHPWLNRPFATPHELMMVPACSAGRLFEEFSVVDPADPDPETLAEGETNTTDATYAVTFVSPFRHLLNFFNSENVKDGAAASAAEFSTLFEFVGTPPPFPSESEVIVPAAIAGSPLADLYSAPFNFNQDNRRIGKINLNTIEEFVVWKGLMQGHLNTGEYTSASGTGTATQLSYNEFVESRRGYVPPGTKTTVVASNASTPVNYLPNQLDPRYPTQFAGVFKRDSTGHLAPQLRDLPTTGNDDREDLRRRRVNAGLLRMAGSLDDQESTGGTSPNPVSLFVRESTQTPAIAPTNLHLNRNRNAFLKYQTLSRMPNLTSDNSQTFVVRITLGFFEVDATNTNNLGKEYKEDMGENERFHALFIVDRSIPVGFIPGQDVNARDTVVFERFYQ